MEEKKLTQNDVADLLESRVGISLKSATISRYNKNGLILMPKRFPNYFNDFSRIYYHPSVPVEIATAYLLFRGDWLKLNSEFRLSRASTQDVYLGRLLFYLYQYNPVDNVDLKPDIQLDFADFLTSTNMFVTDFEGESKTLSMDFFSLESYVFTYRDEYLRLFKSYRIEESYLDYIKNIYRITYLQLYRTIYGPIIRSLPKHLRLRPSGR